MLTVARFTVHQLAGDIGIFNQLFVHLALLVLVDILNQAATAAAIAQRFPFAMIQLIEGKRDQNCGRKVSATCTLALAANSACCSALF